MRKKSIFEAPRVSNFSIGLLAVGVIGMSPVASAEFEDFKSKVFRDSHGVFIVEGDLPLASEHELRSYYDNVVTPTRAGRLIINTVNGRDDRWDNTRKKQLTYCVSERFGADYELVRDAMDEAAYAWESATDVDFIHLQTEDASCSSRNTDVLFDVSPALSGAPYLARAFFPSTTRLQRNVLITDEAIMPFEADLTLEGVLRHELGHVLGFRHEHTRPEAGAPSCVENNNWRVVTDYDSDSVMHYPQCEGTGGWALQLTEFDRKGAALIYDDAGTEATRILDFDGDNKADLAVWRPIDGTFYVYPSSRSCTPPMRPHYTGCSVQWGLQGDVPVPADYDGDGLTDFAVWRPHEGNWYIKDQGTIQYGLSGDIPVPGDYDGDGRIELAVWRGNGVWYIRGRSAIQWGLPGDKPVPGDYNGNGQSDLAVWRPSEGNWYILGQGVHKWGLTGDLPFATDFDGDKKVDLTVVRPSNGDIYTVRSGGGCVSHETPHGRGCTESWPDPGDILVPMDINGDSRDEIVRWGYDRTTRAMTFFAFEMSPFSGGGEITLVPWGLPGDIPLR